MAGVVLSLSAPPVGFFWVLPVAVAAFFVITAGMTPRRAWVPGLAFGVGYCYVLMWWMREVDVYAWVALSGLEALFYGLLGSAVPLLRRLPVWPLWVALAWTAMEVLRSGWPFSGMPWGRLAFAVVDTPAAPALAYVGATGVSLLLALAGAWLAALVLGDTRRLVAGAGLVATGAVLLAPALQPWEPSPDGTIRVASVQGDVPGDGTDVLADFRQVTDNHVQATSTSRRRWRRGSGHVPTSCCGRRTPRRSTRSAMPRRGPACRPRRRRSAYRSWSGPWSTPAPTT